MQTGTRKDICAPVTCLFEGSGNKPAMASGLIEPPAHLESKWLWQLHYNLNSLSCGFFLINANLFCFAN